jgi:hypothetical protein
MQTPLVIKNVKNVDGRKKSSDVLVEHIHLINGQQVLSADPD